MCTRYSLSNIEALRQLLGEFGLATPGEFLARFNVPLSSTMPVVTPAGGGAAWEKLAFGCRLPAREPGTPPLLLANARSETVLAKHTFRDAVKFRRCLVPADGFYEWQHAGKVRLPYYFYRRDHAAFFFAGLWHPESAVTPRSFVIMTTSPNAVLEPVHHRMPVMLTAETSRAWLGDQPLAAAQVTALCAPFPAELMASHRVDPKMSNPRYEAPDCLHPYTPPPQEPTLFD
ncbi:MAG: SOS response-associated peptidase [Candidatus Didemnitutus sp.]|nr:SOS response-associated peptidase [Candidatus Didemnitutus sp.]